MPDNHLQIRVSEQSLRKIIFLKFKKWNADTTDDVAHFFARRTGRDGNKIFLGTGLCRRHFNYLPSEQIQKRV